MGLRSNSDPCNRLKPTSRGSMIGSISIIGWLLLLPEPGTTETGVEPRGVRAVAVATAIKAGYAKGLPRRAVDDAIAAADAADADAAAAAAAADAWVGLVRGLAVGLMDGTSKCASAWLVDMRLLAVGVEGADGDNRVPNNAAKDNGPVVPKALVLATPPPPPLLPPAVKPMPMPMPMPQEYDDGDGSGA
jgi:hypothetical protein